jgi:crotonobetainyl-CoA:carnitine CoA-transferase CaiB-like acyl-CoA transferase
VSERQRANHRHSAGPLSHIRVLDLSRVMAGPWAGQILADLGADVVKVERPGAGDDTRSWGPPFLTGADGQPGDAGYFVAVNRGKRSVTLDLATADGQRVVRELAARSDVVLENFKAGTLARFGLDYDGLRAVKPDLVYCSITGFGQSGPKRDHAAYDFMIQAMGGLMSVTGEPDGVPGGGPQKVGVPIVDIMTGMYAAVGVLAALARRAETGEGEYIDLAMLDVQVAFLANQAANYLLSGKAPRRSGNRHPNIQPQDVFPCRDGHVALAVGNDGQFRKLAQVLGAPELADDPRYATNEARVRNVVALREAIVAQLSEGDTEFWQSQLEKVGVPSSPINTVPAVFDDPQVRHRELLREVTHPVAGPIRQVASPLRLRNAPLPSDRPPPLLGQHTDEVLRELGSDQHQHEQPQH